MTEQDMEIQQLRQINKRLTEEVDKLNAYIKWLEDNALIKREGLRGGRICQAIERMTSLQSMPRALKSRDTG